MRQVGGLSLVGAAVIAFALGTVLANQEREVTLRFQFPVKQIRHYESKIDGEMVMTIQVLGQETPLSMNFQGLVTHTEEVESVDKEGVATIVTTVKGKVKTEATGLPAGAELPPEEEISPVTVRLKMNPLGKVSEMKVEKEQAAPKSPFSPRMLPQVSGYGFQGLILPEKPVRVGDTWDVSTTVTVSLPDAGTKELEVKGQARLVAFEKVNERDCAVIETSTEIPDFGELLQALPIPEEKGKISGHSEGKATSKIWFDIANGFIIRNETTADLNFNFVVSTPTGQSVSISIQGIFRSEQKLTKVTRKGDEKG